ncbi:hypothetical protein EU245_11445 [Lentibacillus lipolyticus]|nr:hypothetical protein EU245_11445 [Lentibacillus lipolyticus]
MESARSTRPPFGVIPEPEVAIPGLEAAIPGPEVAIPDLKTAIPGPEVAIPVLETAIPGPEAAIPKPEVAILPPLGTILNSNDSTAYTQKDDFRPPPKISHLSNTHLEPKWSQLDRRAHRSG